MLVDEFAPDPPFSVVRSLTVDADADIAFSAALAANLLDAPAARLMTSAREAPNRLVARLRRQPLEATPKRICFGDIAESEEWQELGCTPGVEWVAGAIGRFWQRDYGWVTFAPEDFASFAEPDHAKTVIALRAVPDGPDRTTIVYESRTLVTDEQARRHFARYWFVLRPFLGLLQMSALRSIRREAARQVAAP